MVGFLTTWKRYFTFAALLSLFVNMTQLTFSFYMFAIYRNVIVSYSSFSLITITVVSVYALVFLGIFHFVRSRLLSLAGMHLYERLKTRVFTGMLKAHVMSGDRSYSQGMSDLETLQEFFSGNAVHPLFDLPWAPFYLMLIYFIHPILGVIATSGALVHIGMSVLQEVLIRRSMTNANIWNNQNHRFVNAFLRNTEVINGMGMSKAVADWFDRSNSKVILNQTQSSRYAGAIQSIMKPMQNVFQVAIYCAGAYYAMTEGFSVGLMVAASIIMGRGVAPVMQAATTWKVTLQARQAYNRVYNFEQFLNQQPEKMPLFEPKGHFRLEKASYAAGGRFLLADASFELNPGQFLGIIGPSGAGKTTLCKLMLGIWPSNPGKAYLDGMDAFKWDKEVTGRHFGYLPQEIELFPGTLAENIARLGPVDMEKVEKASALCGILPLVEQLPFKFDTVLEGANGIKLSGGQTQMVGMARAVYGDPHILVLDEPTSNLDEQSENIMLSVLARLKQEGKTTCIMVTHKPALLTSMDSIVIVKQGRIALAGPRDEVFATLAGKTGQTQQEAM